MNDRNVSADEAKRIGDKPGVNWAKVDPGHFQRGLDVEFGHGMYDPGTNATDCDVGRPARSPGHTSRSSRNITRGWRGSRAMRTPTGLRATDRCLECCRASVRW